MDANAPDRFPAPGQRRSWARFLLASVIVVVLTAGATATAGLLNVQSFVDDLKAGGTISGAEDVITRAEAGEPQTLLLIGSDHRYGTGVGDARSDTMMLVRIDPDAPATTVLSIPRDLRVDFTWRGERYGPAKLNMTYTVGGEALTAKVIARLLHVRINHIANIEFRGFREAIEEIGCVYVDVDQRYFHRNGPGTEQYAEIDIEPGYQLMCGQRALDYVRYRHRDNDLVRAARQQDFLRQVRSQYGAEQFIDDPHALTKVIGRRMHTDADLQSISSLLKLLRLIAFSARRPIQQVALQPTDSTGPDGAAYLEASDADLARVRRELLEPDAAPKPKPRARRAARRGGRRAARAPTAASLGLVDMAQTGKQYAISLGPVSFPVYSRGCCRPAPPTCPTIAAPRAATRSPTAPRPATAG